MIIGLSGKKQSGKDLATSMIQFLTLEGVVDKSYRAFESDYKYGIDRPTQWKNRKFADKLKEVCALVTGIPRDYFEQQEYKNKTVSEVTGQDWSCWKVYDDISNSFTVHMYEADALSRFHQLSGYGKMEKFDMTLRHLLQYTGTDCFRSLIHPNVWVLALMADYKQPIYGRVTGDYPKWIISDVRFPNEISAIKDKSGITLRIERERLVSNDTHISETALDNYENFNYIVSNTSMKEFYYNLKSVLEKENIL